MPSYLSAAVSSKIFTRKRARPIARPEDMVLGPDRMRPNQSAGYGYGERRPCRHQYPPSFVFRLRVVYGWKLLEADPRRHHASKTVFQCELVLPSAAICTVKTAFSSCHLEPSPTYIESHSICFQFNSALGGSVFLSMRNQCNILLNIC
jgi:hypothetical protein